MIGSFYSFIQEIRERPALWLGEKSLKALVQFWDGYSFREHVEAWERLTGRNFFENFNEAICSEIPGVSSGPHLYSKSGFNKFVHLHYNCEIGVMSAYWLISSKSKSEEEAFDKFLELLDEFLEQKGD